MSAVLTAKLVSLFIVWIVCIILGGLPYFILKRRINRQHIGQRGDTILSLFNAFSGGVFLGTCLLHLLVEGQEEMTEAFDVSYPVFEVLVAGGFFAIVFVDLVAERCLHDSTTVGPQNGNDKPSSAEINRAYRTSMESISDNNRRAYGSISEHNTKHQVLTAPPSDTRGITQNQGTVGESTTIAAAAHNHDGHIHDNAGHSHGHEFDQLAKTSTVRATLLLIALSFHTIFDGLAIGLQEGEKDVWQVLAAISIHKGLVSFCLGLQLFQAYENRLRIAASLIFLFAIISPIGVGIGIVVTSANIDDTAQKMASAILQGLATGTFFYVTFFEILKDAFSDRKGIWNILVACVGFAAMALVKLLDSD